MQCISIVAVTTLPFRSLQTQHNPIFKAFKRALDKNPNHFKLRIGGLFSKQISTILVFRRYYM
jgi:hypothetical protein